MANIRIEIAKAIHGPCGFAQCPGWNAHDLPIADRVIATGIDLSPRYNGSQDVARS